MAQKLRHRTDYRERRRAEYPIAGDALDAIAKGFRALIDQGVSLPAETVAWVESCETVKSKFKKPQG
jgi:hypothetical protein